MLSIINDILDFSKIESGKLEIIPADYEFSSLVNDVISIIRMRAIDSRLKFAVNIDRNIPNELFGDEVRIRQILLNILSNAVKYTKNGFVSLTVRGETAPDGSAVNLVMTVADSGKGIKEEDMGKLFGDFVQVDMANNKGIEGTGLGLAITMSLVKAMGGDISVSSEYGNGSVFTVTLPQKIRGAEKLATVQNPKDKSVLIYEPREIYADSIVSSLENLEVRCTLAVSDAEFRDALAKERFPFVFAASSLSAKVKKMCEDAGSDARIVSLVEFGEVTADQTLNALSMPAYSIPIANVLNGNTGKYAYAANTEALVKFTAPDARILIVDDINTNLKVAEGLLSPYGMRITTCKSGAEAVDAVRAEKYDLVLMDHMMPQMDGIEAMNRIREIGNCGYDELPVVALTANAVSGMKEMFLKCGFNDYLSKPIDTVKLNAVLELWIPKGKQIPKTEAAQNAAASSSDGGDVVDINIEGVDVKKGIAIMGGRVENYLQTLAVFSREGREKIGWIKKALESNDLQLYATYVHGFKSAAANIGAGAVSNAAQDLEAAAKANDRASVDAGNAEFLSSLTLLISNIYNYLKTANAKNKAATDGDANIDIKAMKNELAKLKTSIVYMNVSEINTSVKKLTQLTSYTEGKLVIDNILRDTLIGEYDNAVLLIDKLLAEGGNGNV